MMNSEKIFIGDSYVSFMDLFVGGLTNLCSDLFCDISVLSNLLDIRGKLPAINIGSAELEFCWKFIQFITKENLAVLDFDACLCNWEERMLCPRILAPLTSRGIQCRDYVAKLHPGAVCESLASLDADWKWDDRMEKLTID